MPNWCSNYVSVSHSDPAMLDKFLVAAKEENIAHTFFPVPESVERHQEQGFLSNAEYDWRVANWGTKWDFGGDFGRDFDGDSDTVTGYVNTANAPPVGVFAALEEQGFIVSAYWHEGGMCFAGEYENGETIDYSDIEYTDEGLSKLPETIVELFNLADMIEEEEDED